MKSDAVIIAKSQERARLYECVRDVVTNPAIDVIAGIILIEYLQSHVETAWGPPITSKRVAGGGWMGANTGTAAEAGLIAFLLAPSMIQVAKQIEPVAKALAPIAGTVLLK